MLKVSRRSDQFFQRCEPNYGKKAVSHNVVKVIKLLYPDQEADDVQNLIRNCPQVHPIRIFT